MHESPDSQFRYKITVEYVGTNFSGWQRQQAGVPSVQQAIEDAIKGFSREAVVLHAAGRTDAGVHAYGQVAHFDLSRHYDARKVMYAANYFLKDTGVVITDSELVDDSFHARFSAKHRHYVYKILNRLAPTSIDANRVWWIAHTLDTEAMREGAEYLIGKHDFTSFRAAACQSASSIKTLSKVDIIKEGKELLIYCSAPSFLHHMVRNIVGTLVAVGTGKITPCTVKDILEAKDRARAGITAPAHGLYFLRVDY